MFDQKELEKFTRQQLENLILISTEAVKDLRRRKVPKNQKFWQIVNIRERLISEVEVRKNANV